MNDVPPCIYFSISGGKINVDLHIPDNSQEKDVMDFAALCIIIIDKNAELMDICIEKAKKLKHFSDLIVGVLTTHRGKRKSRPAVSPLEALNF